MNNEEKILAILTALQADIADVKAAQTAQGTQLAAVVDQLNVLEGQVSRGLTTQEQDILPYIKLLDEGHHTIMDKLPEKSIVEAHEKDMRLVKAAIKNHTQRIAALEKAN